VKQFRGNLSTSAEHLPGKIEKKNLAINAVPPESTHMSTFGENQFPEAQAQKNIVKQN
jgi:hypothetical protein